MYCGSSQELFWATALFALGPWGGFGSLGVNRERENEFVALGYSVARAFNLTNCWVCGGPLGLESWPWTSVPLSPEWLLSNYSEVESDAYWEEGAPPPRPVRYPAQGGYRLNRTQEGGVFMAISKCTWTYTYGSHCLVDSCEPLNCSRPGNESPFLQSGPQGYCKLFNSSDESFVPRWLGWAWVNKTGHRRLFSSFWSLVNHTNVYLAGVTDDYTLPCNSCISCSWRNSTGAWSCRIRDLTHNKPKELYHPLGASNSTYFQNPWTSTGLFENGTRALKGHHWVCGRHAYKLLPANWTGACYVGVIRPLFFVLPGDEGKDPGVRLNDDLTRHKR